MKGGPTISLEALREALDDLTPHLSAENDRIDTGPGAGMPLRRLYALAELRLVKVSDGQEPHLYRRC